MIAPNYCACKESWRRVSREKGNGATLSATCCTIYKMGGMWMWLCYQDTLLVAAYDTQGYYGNISHSTHRWVKPYKLRVWNFEMLA